MCRCGPAVELLRVRDVLLQAVRPKGAHRYGCRTIHGAHTPEEEAGHAGSDGILLGGLAAVEEIGRLGGCGKMLDRDKEGRRFFVAGRAVSVGMDNNGHSLSGVDLRRGGMSGSW